MKRILYITYFYSPDLSAGSFRNSSLAQAFAKEIGNSGEIDLYTSQPNRYHSYKVKAAALETEGNLTIHRVSIPPHKNTFSSQAFSYRVFFKTVMSQTRNKKYDLVFVSSGRFFSSYLGYKIAKRNNTPLYLDIRDIFSDTIKSVMHRSLFRKVLISWLEHLERKPFGYAAHINLVSEGFKKYFMKYPAEYSYFTNGIDDIFLDEQLNASADIKPPFIITYAGNIGEGQGLEKIIPEAARLMGNGYHFKIIGDGGSRSALEYEIKQSGLLNVELIRPADRHAVMKLYENSHFLFLHLNDYEAFRHVLPSKLFEYAAYPFPILAGVEGYAREFIDAHLNNTIVFQPCNASDLFDKLSSYQYRREMRDPFIAKFRRSDIVKQMAADMKKYIS